MCLHEKAILKALTVDVKMSCHENSALAAGAGRLSSYRLLVELTLLLKKRLGPVPGLHVNVFSKNQVTVCFNSSVD